MDKLTVKKLTNRFDFYPDEKGQIVWEIRDRPDYVDAVDIRLHIGFLAHGRIFKHEVEKITPVLEEAIHKHFKDAIPAMVVEIEKVINA
jgi:hypothetical protein